MRAIIGGAVVACLLVVASSSRAEDAEESEFGTQAQWRRVFERIAASYKLILLPEEQDLALVDRATYTWARSGPFGGTYGAVYVWTHRGNAEAVACFWRNPGASGKLSMVHELHSLSPVRFDSRGEGSESWKPKAGVKRVLVPDAPLPAATAIGRMRQMRELCREFSAHSVSLGGERTELRLLPQPLYRFQSTDPEVVDGGLFAFVCSVGTDPEVFLQLEARDTPQGSRWHFVAARFSHMNLFVNYRDKEVWQAIRDEANPMAHNADHTYWVFGQPFDISQLEAASRE